MHRLPVIVALSAVLLPLAAAFAETAKADELPDEIVTRWSPNAPGIAYGFAAGLTRTGGSSNRLSDFTVAGQFVAKNGPGVHQWAFGTAVEAWALPGSQSLLVGLESAVINEEPQNRYPKIANNAVMKNRGDGQPVPGTPMNENSIAYWVSSQTGTGFERGLVFDSGSLVSVRDRPAAIDLSDLPDDQIGQVDLIRIRKDVALRFDPVTKTLVLYVESASPVGSSLR